MMDKFFTEGSTFRTISGPPVFNCTGDDWSEYAEPIGSVVISSRNMTISGTANACFSEFSDFSKGFIISTITKNLIEGRQE